MPDPAAPPSLSLLLVLTLLLVHLALPAAGQCDLVRDPLDASRVYDLSPLSNPSQDYRLPNPRYPTYEFFMNVCRSILATDDACPHGTGNCERASFSSSNLGRFATSYSVLRDGVLEMVMEAGGGGQFRTRVTFYCTPGAGVGAPSYISESPGEFVFEWKTEHACSRAAVQDPCVFQVGGRGYNLTSLNQVYRIKTASNFEYYLNPCSRMASQQSPCQGGKSYGCQFSSSGSTFAIGNAHFGTEYSGGEGEGKLVATYSEGDYCPLSSSWRSFVITYTCGPNLGQPVFVKEVSCVYYFEWATSEVCEEVVPSCQFSMNGKPYDLSPLNKDWVADGGIYNYFLNPCGLLSTPGLPAACADSHACQQYKSAVQTGYSLAKTLDGILEGSGGSNNTFTFVFKEGSSCSSSVKRSAEIYFGCGTSIGNPIFVSEISCAYRFQWLTSLAC